MCGPVAVHAPWGSPGAIQRKFIQAWLVPHYSTSHCPYNETHGGRGIFSGTTALSLELGRRPVTYAAAALAPPAALPKESRGRINTPGLRAHPPM